MGWLGMPRVVLMDGKGGERDAQVGADAYGWEGTPRLVQGEDGVAGDIQAVKTDGMGGTGLPVGAGGWGWDETPRLRQGGDGVAGDGLCGNGNGGTRTLWLVKVDGDGMGWNEDTQPGTG